MREGRSVASGIKNIIDQKKKKRSPDVSDSLLNPPSETVAEKGDSCTGSLPAGVLIACWPACKLLITEMSSPVLDAGVMIAQPSVSTACAFSECFYKVAVEGNIGCGKSTFLKYFESLSSNIEVSLEPIELWNNVKGHKLFEMFYADPGTWSSPLQSQVMVTYLHRQATPQASLF
nr:unnamed protein product [Spirometra erinaceieuropaei]